MGRPDQQLHGLRRHIETIMLINGDTTGVFTQGRQGSYGIQSITDGTSNTIAFGESLIGDLQYEL